MLCCHSASLSGRFPPNSLAAVAECIEASVPRLEVDVRFLADDAIATFHDGGLELPGRGRRELSEITRDDLSHWRYPWPSGPHGICFLEDVVDLVRGSNTLLQVDLKLVRPISAARASILSATLSSVREQVLVGSQAHWNLRRLTSLPIAFDPTLHWHYAPEHPLEDTPRTRGVHGMWDDAPLAANHHASAEEYAFARIADLRALLPRATEWMVDLGTVRHLGSLGISLGEVLEKDGCELAAWTLRETTPGRVRTLTEMFRLGATTVITDVPLLASSDLAGTAEL